MLKKYIPFLLLLVVFACDNSNTNPKPEEKEPQLDQLTLFFVNDQHGQLDNFAKIKKIVDEAKADGNALLLCAGDMFSGNPIVDQYAKKGFPMIDVMNQTGFDVSVVGNHEFDYGPETLKDRMAQADFKWVCANMDVGESDLPQPPAYVNLEVGDLKVTVLGLVETNGKPDDVIPSTHPWRVLDFSFDYFYDVAADFADVKEEEEADLFIALTHLGSSSDRYLAENFPYFDVIIGGHSHQVINEKVAGIPIFQTGSYLHNLGKVVFYFEDGEITDCEMTMINLDEIDEVDESLAATIANYNEAPGLDEVVGFSAINHSGTEVGCFYTDALRSYMQVDFSMQNGGGTRAGINEGDITRREIFAVDPFNNGSVVFTMTVQEIKDFLRTTGAGFHMSGITVDGECQDICIYDENGKELSNETSLTLGMNDYIAAVYENYFPLQKAEIRDLTTAESILEYMKTLDSEINYEGCNQYQSAN